MAELLEKPVKNNAFFESDLLKEAALLDTQYKERKVFEFAEHLQELYERPLQEFCASVIANLAEKSAAISANFYIYKETDHKLHSIASFAGTGQSVFAVGQGLVGQAYSSKKPYFFCGLKANLPVIEGISAVPIPISSMAVVPAVFHDKVFGVIELFFTRDLEEDWDFFLRKVAPSIGAVAESILNREKMQALLEEMSEQSHALRSAEEELRQNLEEMSAIQDLLSRQKEDLEEISLFQKAILDNAGAMVIGTDTHGRISLFNPAAERLLGYFTEDALQLESVIDLMDKDLEVFKNLRANASKSEYFSHLAFACAQGQSFEVDTQLIRRNDSTFPAHICLSPLFNQQDTLIGYILIAQDLTKRKEAEQALIQQQRNLDAVVASLDDVVLQLRPSGEVLRFWIAEECENLGFNLLKEGDNICSFLDKEAAVDFLKALQIAASERKSMSIECKRAADNTYMRVKMTFNYEDQQGPLVSACIEDVTELKRNERKTRESEARLNEAQAVANLGNWYIDLIEGKVHASQHFLTILELNSEEGLVPSFLWDKAHEEDVELILESMAKAHEEGYVRYEYRMLLDSGEIKYVENIIKIDKNDQGQLAGYFGTTMDVTNHVLVRQELDNEKKRTENMLADLTASINYAKRIQASLLPSSKQVSAIGEDRFVIYLPKNIVSGDFYWIAECADCAMLAIIDCTGHGVPGAFMAAIANDMLDNIVCDKHNNDPHLVLKEMDKALRSRLGQGETKVPDTMEVALCYIDKEKGNLHYAGAMLPLYYFHNGQYHEVKGDKYSIGGHGKDIDFDFVAHTLPYEKGSTFYLSTDGYRDQFGGERFEKFRSSRFRELLQKIQVHSMEKQQRILLDTLQAWKGDRPQTDDILVFGFKA